MLIEWFLDFIRLNEETHKAESFNTHLSWLQMFLSCDLSKIYK